MMGLGFALEELSLRRELAGLAVFPIYGVLLRLGSSGRCLLNPELCFDICSIRQRGVLGSAIVTRQDRRAVEDRTSLF